MWAAPALAAVLALLTPATPTAPPAQGNPRAPVWAGNPAASMRLRASWLGVSPDGVARILVSADLFDAHGQPTRLVKGGDFDYATSAGVEQWQTRARYLGPAMIVRTEEDGPFSARMKPLLPAELPAAALAIDTRAWRNARVAAAALGPHLVQIGWFPRERGATVQIVRSDAAVRRSVVGIVAAPSSTYRDETVLPGHTYRYVVRRNGRALGPPLRVSVPAEPAPTSAVAVNGKGMWLFFSPSRYDENWIGKWDVGRIVDLAAAAGLHHLEVRTAYGEYWQITPDAKPMLDALIDRAAERGIAVIGWTVPRAPSFEDLAATVATAYYRTAAGHGFAAIAIDLERGEEYLGDGPPGRAALADYARRLRAALGKGTAIIGTVEDPSLSRLSDAAFPYAAIGRNVDVLQPMVYWRALGSGAASAPAVREVLLRAAAAVRRECRCATPLSVGGQTTELGRRGLPSPAEITASLAAAKLAGALGETFFDWDGTMPEQWDALARFRW